MLPSILCPDFTSKNYVVNQNVIELSLFKIMLWSKNVGYE